jgi:hypothetical protein
MFTILNVTECIDCLDHEKVVWKYDKLTKSPIIIEKYAFHNNRFTESCIFKIPETSSGEVLLVEGLRDQQSEFRKVLENYDLKGLTFELLWES